MTTPADWVRNYARQADADLKAWENYAKYPQAVAAECHRLLFLQMACEKLCKAHLIQQGTDPEVLQTSHAYVANPLPVIIRQQVIAASGTAKGMQWILHRLRHLAEEIEVLNPAVNRNGRRPDNCEYPWEAGNTLRSPLDWQFQPSQFAALPAGRAFLKLLRTAIDDLLG